MNINDIKVLTTADMTAVDELIKKRLYSEVVLVNQVSQYIVNSGGKRLRPLLALLSAKAYGYQGEEHFSLAAIVEFIHTATLLHDDVVDESLLRRGADTANALFGNAASVLVGDFLYSRSFQMMVELNNLKIMGILSESTNIIAEGEVLQLMNCHDADTTEARYIEVIHFKTAKLFEAATRLGAIICDRTEAEEQAMASYGMHLGTAFQLIDDVLDYSSSSEEMGKNVGDDLAEGKPTLPLIYAMRNGNAEEAALVRKAIEEGGLNYIDEIMAIIKKTGAIEYTEAAAKREAELAIAQLSHLAESEYKQALIALAEYSVNRTF
ncbi:MAG: octaprenyl diphosphate synthase [Gammaproteobacteria bacterium]|nr:octaprenyl diphosphate synthase [Gammaproteobacteria bacterium]